jgi:hypothetical protein
MIDFKEWFDEYMKRCPKGTKNSRGHRWIDRQWMTEHKLWTDHCAKCGWRRIWDVHRETLILDEFGVWITCMPGINKLRSNFRSATVRFTPELKHSDTIIEDKKPKQPQSPIRIPQIL